MFILFVCFLHFRFKVLELPKCIEWIHNKQIKLSPSLAAVPRQATPPAWSITFWNLSSNFTHTNFSCIARWSQKILGKGCNIQKSALQKDLDFLKKVVFSDKATFHLCGKVSKHNARIWGTERPTTFLQPERNPPKMYMLCSLSCERVNGPIFFDNDTINILNTIPWHSAEQTSPPANWWLRLSTGWSAASIGSWRQSIPE